MVDADRPVEVVEEELDRRHQQKEAANAEGSLTIVGGPAIDLHSGPEAIPFVHCGLLVRQEFAASADVRRYYSKRPRSQPEKRTGVDRESDRERTEGQDGSLRRIGRA